MKIFLVLSILTITSNVLAETKWANCPGIPQTLPIREVFWNSAANIGTGPDYALEEGKIFRNSGEVCRGGEALKASDWIAELKSGLSPAKSVSAFREIHSAADFQKFLKSSGVVISAQEKLAAAVKAYLESKPLTDETLAEIPVKANNPAIIVGSSDREAVIVLASSGDGGQNASLMEIKLK